MDSTAVDAAAFEKPRHVANTALSPSLPEKEKSDSNEPDTTQQSSIANFRRVFLLLSDERFDAEVEKERNDKGGRPSRRKIPRLQWQSRLYKKCHGAEF